MANETFAAPTNIENVSNDETITPIVVAAESAEIGEDVAKAFNKLVECVDPVRSRTELLAESGTRMSQRFPTELVFQMREPLIAKGKDLAISSSSTEKLYHDNVAAYAEAMARYGRLTPDSVHAALAKFNAGNGLISLEPNMIGEVQGNFAVLLQVVSEMYGVLAQRLSSSNPVDVSVACDVVAQMRGEKKLNGTPSADNLRAYVDYVNGLKNNCVASISGLSGTIIGWAERNARVDR